MRIFAAPEMRSRMRCCCARSVLSGEDFLRFGAEVRRQVAQLFA
jgi:hypothetical protein